MLEVQEEYIDKITEVFYRILRGETPHFVELPEDYPDNEIKQVTTYINRFIAEYNKLADFMYSLAKGELDYEAPKGKMTVLQSFKSLQASLRHLAWKTQQIANGNFNHRVDFMGDFSTAFNRMTQQLKEAFEKIEKQNEELEQQRKWLEVILSSIGDGVIATDTNGIMTFMNPVAERLTGWKVQDALGQPLTEVLLLVNEKTRQAVDISVERVLQAGVAVSLAHHSILISREEQDIPVESRGAPIRGQDGTIHGVILVFHDIRDRRKAEEEQKTLEHQLRQSQKMEALGTLAGGIAHDFNNILGTILGYTEIVFHKQPEGSAEK